jgi:hypothetical protein
MTPERSGHFFNLTEPLVVARGHPIREDRRGSDAAV